MIKLGKGKPVIDPFEMTEKSRATLPSDRFILTFTMQPFEVARSLLSSVKDARIYAPNLGSVVGVYRSVKICVARLPFGAPASAFALEILIAHGARKFIVIGQAGAIHPSLKIGDVLIPTWGIREEGTSYHYMPPDYVPHPDRKLVKALEEEIRKLAAREKITVKLGGVWTTDAPFRETRDKVEEYSKIGVLGVEMEATALMTIAEYRGVSLAVVLAISDELYGEKWRAAFKSERLKKTESLLARASLEVLAKH